MINKLAPRRVAINRMHKTRSKYLIAVFAAILAAGVTVPAWAQTQSSMQTSGSTRPRTSATPPVVAPSPTPTAEEAATEQEALYGLQGVLVETLDGSTVSTQAADDAFNPASALKLATALVALRTFGPEHRFSTGAWTDGSIDKATGTINGNLYISGRDPSFHYAHGVMIARQLNALGIRTVNGDLVIGPGFTMNFRWSARTSGSQLYETLDATLRSGAATRSWLYERGLLGDKASLASVPSVVVMGEVRVEPVASDAKLLLSHRSSKLVDILKVLLCYSNNFMAERIGDSMGGVQAVRRNLIETLRLSPDEIQMASLSGLGINRASPRTMMKIFRALREELRKHRLSTTDIMPVAGIDPGTMETRFTNPAYRGSVIAKTGTLLRTDGGASSLVGQLKTASGATLLFVIMNRRGSVWKFRLNQDFLVMQIQSSRGGPASFSYKPRSLAMKLSDTQSSFAGAGEEFEPVNKLSNAPQ
ncbi:MAG: D-alanyl-D-alanine carboxypeptidase [Acidobacteriota bacterium]|nr:D-alanyl-D-alanine carboxypeptidase [Acidobacteriota bacterium]